MGGQEIGMKKLTTVLITKLGQTNDRVLKECLESDVKTKQIQSYHWGHSPELCETVETETGVIWTQKSIEPNYSALLAVYLFNIIKFISQVKDIQYSLSLGHICF